MRCTTQSQLLAALAALPQLLQIVTAHCMTPTPLLLRSPQSSAFVRGGVPDPYSLPLFLLSSPRRCQILLVPVGANPLVSGTTTLGGMSPAIKGACCTSRRHRQSTLRNQFHRPLDRNPHRALRLVDPAVVVQQQVLALM